MLIEVHSRMNVVRNDGIMAPHAVHLNGEQYGDAKLVQISRRGDDRCPTPTLSVKNDAGGLSLLGIKHAVPIRVQRAPDQVHRERAVVIGDRFGIDAGPFAQPERELPNAAVRVVPAVKSPQKSDHQGRSSRHGRGCSQVRCPLRKQKRRTQCQQDCRQPHPEPFSHLLAHSLSRISARHAAQALHSPPGLALSRVGTIVHPSGPAQKPPIHEPQFSSVHSESGQVRAPGSGLAGAPPQRS